MSWRPGSNALTARGSVLPVTTMRSSATPSWASWTALAWMGAQHTSAIWSTSRRLLFWHGAIAAAQASLDVDQRNAAGIRRERTRQSRVRVTLDDDRTRGVRQQVGRHRGGG